MTCNPTIATCLNTSYTVGTFTIMPDASSDAVGSPDFFDASLNTGPMCRAEPDVSPYFAADPSQLVGFPFASEPAEMSVPEPTSVLDFDPMALQTQAFRFHQGRLDDEIGHLQAQLPEAGVYSLPAYWTHLPTPVQNQWHHWRYDEGVYFSLNWHENIPEIVIFRPQNRTTGNTTSVVVNADDNQLYMIDNAPMQGLPEAGRGVYELPLPTFSLSAEMPAGPIPSDSPNRIGLNDDGEVMLIRQPEAGEERVVVFDNSGRMNVENYADIRSQDRLTFEAGEPVDEASVWTISRDNNEELLLLGGGMFAMGSLQTPSAQPNGVRPGLPYGRMAAYGTGGAAMFLGIHYGLIELGVPEDLAPYATVPVMIGGLEFINHSPALWGSSARVFPNGVGYGNMARAMPHVMVASVGISTGLDAVGWEYGSWENTVGTVGITSTGYVGLSHTNNLLATATRSQSILNGTATSFTFAEQLAAQRFVENSPRVMAFAQNSPRVVSAFAYTSEAFAVANGAGMSTGSYAGLAGGGTALSGVFQVVGAVGAVALGNWVGGGIVSLWAELSGASDDPDFQLIDFTWNYMNHQAGGWVADMFGPVIKGIQTLTISDEVWDGMEHHWDMWAGDLNRFGDGAEDLLLASAITSVSLDPVAGSEGRETELNFNMDIMQSAVRHFYRENRTDIAAAYGLYRRFDDTGVGTRLSGGSARRVCDLVSSSGGFSSSEMRTYLRGRIQRAEREGELQPMVARVLGETERFYAQRMLDLGLAHEQTIIDPVSGEESVRVVNNNIPPHQQTPEQRTFLYGGENVYHAITSGQLTDPSEIQSEAVTIQRRIAGLRAVNSQLLDDGQSSQMKVEDILFPNT